MYAHVLKHIFLSVVFTKYFHIFVVRIKAASRKCPTAMLRLRSATMLLLRQSLCLCLFSQRDK